MCGIAGFAADGEHGIPRRTVRQAIAALAHRGPDDYGFLSVSRGSSYLGKDLARHDEDARLALVHRRLSILDLSAAGRQPMTTPDGRYAIVFNGEIYNYIELREELETLGYEFRSASDTEVLLSAYVQWGPAALNRLVGMFAFAIYDEQENSLFLARDFFGIKPLFYSLAAGEFSFASEIKVLLDNLSLSRQVNADRLYLYLRYGMTDHGDQTLFKQVRQVPAAHYMTVDLNTMTAGEPTRYWRVRLEEPIDVSFDEAAATVREMFLDNVRLHLRSDVPVGAALSGGIDSSAIVMAMRHLAGRDLDLHLFSYIAGDSRLSEERWVDLIARRSGGTVHKVRLTPGELLTDLEHVTNVHDEPISSTSPYAQHKVFQAAHRDGIKVMLDGQGADEILGGYQTYLGARLATLLRTGELRAATRFWNRCATLPGCGRTGLALHAANHLLSTRIQDPLRRLMGRNLAPSWINMRWFEAHGVVPAALNHTKARDVLRFQLVRELEELSLPRLLRYEDRNSMAFSVESRVPFLTPGLVSYLMSLPEHYIISPEGVTKSVFRAAMRGIVPDEILDRRDKIGFATPERKWLTALAPWAERTFAGAAETPLPVLNLRETNRDWKLITRGKRRFDFRTWRCLNLIEWSHQYRLEYK